MCRRQIRFTTSCTARLFLTGALVFSSADSAAAAVHVVALRGDNPFNTGEVATFASFSAPSLNNRAQVAFAAQLTGDDVTTGNDTGYWITTEGTMNAVGREGTSAPGMPTGTLFGNTASTASAIVGLNDAGDIAFSRTVTLPNSATSSGLWVGGQHSLALLAAQGAEAPGAENGATFFGISTTRVSINRRGDVAFTTNLNGEPYNSVNSFNSHDGLFVLNRDGPVASVLVGMDAPQLGDDALLVGFPTAFYPAINRFGETAFETTHKLAPSSSTSGDSIWVAANGGIQLHAATGEPLPELGEDAALTFLRQPAINASGTVVASGSFSGSDGNPAAGSAIILSDAAGISLPAVSGGPAPGTNGHVFSQTFYEPSIGNGGHIAFFGSEWSGAPGTPSFNGVWAGRPDDLQLVALQGTEAPGIDAMFGGFIRNTPGINRFGQIAFSVILSQADGNKNSLWATDLDGDLTLIARVGDTLEVAPGDVRTIGFLSMITNYGDDDGRPRSMNDLGQIAFHAGFNDGTSGIFLSDAVAHLPGDYNSDQIVDTADYLVWRKAIATQDLTADGDRDGIIGAGDRAIWNEFFGMSLVLDSGAGGASVPEPGAALLVDMFCATLLFQRRGRRFQLDYPRFVLRALAALFGGPSGEPSN